MVRDDAKAAVLRANATFYQAFTQGDFPAMQDLWSARSEITCFHPGSPLLRGRAEVLRAWQQILTEPAPVELCCHEPQVQLQGRIAIVTCYEGNGTHPAHLAATNVFALEEEGWKLLHHQAGPLVQARTAPRVNPSRLN